MNKNGFGKLLLEVQNKVKRLKNPSTIIRTLFTLDGKIAESVGVKSLNIEQNAIYQCLTEHNSRIVFTSELENVDENRIYFGITEYGRILLGADNFFDDYALVLGYFVVNEQVIKIINEKIRKALEIEEEIYNKEVKNFFKGKSKDEINEIIKFIKFNIYHMAPILLYVKDKTFSTFYNYNNLIKEFDGDTEDFLLNDLPYKSAEKWDKAEKIFVFNMYLLLKSGPPSRGEEVNGIHFSLSFLKDYFNEKIKEYSHILKRETNSSLSLEKQVARIYSLRKEIENSYLIYRYINGLNLHKEERYIDKSELAKLNDGSLKTDLEKFTSIKFKKDYYHYFCQIIEKNIDKEPYQMIEKIMDMIINKAIDRTSSDIGMARGFRAPLKFYEAHQKDKLEEIFNWGQNQYFCCVIPSSLMKDAFQDNSKILAGILTAISKRMEYNSWHYTPGNFLNNQTRITCHFYFPPVMADITMWSDQHHKGHVFAKVKHAIRCPGFIENGATIYNAFFDLRLMKQSGSDYSKNDLVIAIYYKEILKSLFQSWFDICKKTKKEININIYSREWYQNKYTKDKVGG
ncbi:hypothetical protein JRG04_09795 [Staphylococcus capitis]|uniref:hypothetical protein n=1 Tax=Staphylococcus capitis TaxID=29388 RepID=UPI0019D2233D|nr:hypothetical protein [Staphylococcus capitis]MBN6860778.1 hypothetical protein [Staphylococcus capitis]